MTEALRPYLANYTFICKVSLSVTYLSVSKIHISHSLLRLSTAPSRFQTFIPHARTTVAHSCFHAFHALLLDLINNCLYSVETRYCLDIWRWFSNPSCYSCFTAINLLCLCIFKVWNADKLIETYLIQRHLLIFPPKFYHYHAVLSFL